jgi:hypothetical protein
MRSVLFWVVTQRVVVIPYRRFRTFFKSLEDWSDRLFRKVDKDLPLHAAWYPRRAPISSTSRRKSEIILSYNVYGQAQFCFCGFKSCVSDETKSLGTVASRWHSVQTTGYVRVECWRLVIGRGKFKPPAETCFCAISQPHIAHLQLLNPGLIGETPKIRHLSRIPFGKNLSNSLAQSHFSLVLRRYLLQPSQRHRLP